MKKVAFTVMLNYEKRKLENLNIFSFYFTSISAFLCRYEFFFKYDNKNNSMKNAYWNLFLSINTKRLLSRIYLTFQIKYLDLKILNIFVILSFYYTVATCLN